MIFAALSAALGSSAHEFVAARFREFRKVPSHAPQEERQKVGTQFHSMLKALAPSRHGFNSMSTMFIIHNPTVNSAHAQYNSRFRGHTD